MRMLSGFGYTMIQSVGDESVSGGEEEGIKKKKEDMIRDRE